MTEQDYIIPQWLDKPYLQSVLRKNAGESECPEVIDFSVKVATKKGENYSSEMFRIALATSDGEKHSLILKKPHTEKDRSSVVDAYDFFGKEIRFYTKYLSALDDILRSVDEFEGLTPELIYCDVDNEVLIMKDLSQEGFATGDRVNRVCRKTAKVFMRKLAKYHAATLILNQKMNGELEKVIFDSFIVDGPFRAYFEQHPHALVEEVKSWGPEYESLVPKLERIAESYCKVAHNATISKRGLNVLVHGDPWYTNLLVQKSENAVEDVRMIDFQLNSWASLAIDLLYFFFRALNEEDYEDGLDYLLEIYHGHLERVLRKLDYENIPNFDDIKGEIRDNFFHGELNILF